LVIFNLIKILVLALLLPVSANAGFHSGDVEEHKRLSRLIMQHGEIIHSTAMKDFRGNEIVGDALYQVRIDKGSSNRMKLQAVPQGIYLCHVGVGYDDKGFMSCKKL
jgi:hypothetical protein